MPYNAQICVTNSYITLYTLTSITLWYELKLLYNKDKITIISILTLYIATLKVIN